MERVVSLSGLYHLGRAFATLEWMVDYHRRGRVNKQVARILGQGASRGAIRRACWRHFVRLRNDKMLFLIVDRMDDRRMSRRFKIINEHLLTEALQRGRGVYLAMCHLGSQHLIMHLFVNSGYAMSGVRAAKVGAVWRFIQDKYRRSNRPSIEYFYAGAFPRNIFRRFRDNAVVASLIDVHAGRETHHKTIDAELFGERWPMLAGPLQIAMRCGAPVVQAFVVSLGNYHYRLELHGPLIDPSDHQEESAEVLSAAVKQYAAGVERFARAHPCHISRY